MYSGSFSSSALKRSTAPGTPARAVVVIADVVFVLAQAIAGLAQPRLALFELRIVGIALDKDREFLDGFARFGLIAVGAVHLLEMRHAELELRVAGAVAVRVEGEELLELVQRQDVRLGRALADVGVADAEFGFRAVGRLRIGVDELAEVFAGDEPSLLARAPRCRARTGTCRAQVCRSAVSRRHRRTPRPPLLRRSTARTACRPRASR